MSDFVTFDFPSFTVSTNPGPIVTYSTLPEYRRPTDRIADGRYRPRYLGLDLVGVVAINVGPCIYEVPWADDVLAHAHPDGEICCRDGRYVVHAGRPDPVMFHEYAHVIAGYDAEHGPAWRQIARTLGVPALRACQYEYVGEPDVAA